MGGERMGIKPLLTRVLRSFGVERLVGSIWTHTRNFGLKYRCPMCRARLKAFLPGGEHHAVLTEKSIVGGGRRANVVCPVCGSEDRERLAYLYLKNRPHLLSGGTKLLHIAPEYNLSSWLRSKAELDYVSADLARDDVDLNIDLTKIPFPNSTFNAVGHLEKSLSPSP